MSLRHQSFLLLKTSENIKSKAFNSLLLDIDWVKRRLKKPKISQAIYIFSLLRENMCGIKKNVRASIRICLFYLSDKFYLNKTLLLFNTFIILKYYFLISFLIYK